MSRLLLLAVACLALGGCGETRVKPAPSASEASTAPTTVPESPRPRPSVPEDFPLGAGWPTRFENSFYGSEVPVDRLEYDIAGFVCDAPLPRADDAAHLLGLSEDVTDHRTRELLVFADADDAVAWMRDARTVLDACPDHTLDGYPLTTIGQDTRIGGQSFGRARFGQFEGNRTSQLTAVHLVRLGRAVLVDSADNEAGFPPGTYADAAAAQMERMIADSAEVVAAMCRFTEAGC